MMTSHHKKTQQVTFDVIMINSSIALHMSTNSKVRCGPGKSKNDLTLSAIIVFLDHLNDRHKRLSCHRIFYDPVSATPFEQS